MASEICLPQTTFYTYLFILFCIFLMFGYVYVNRDKTKQELEEQVARLQEELYKMSLAEQKCRGALEVTQQQGPREYIQTRFLNKIYNPLSGTSPDYPGGSFSTPPFDGFREFQMLGFLSGPNGQFPVMGRYRFSNTTDRLEYYTLNEGRNRIKIPFRTKNDNELFSGDPVNIPELGGELVFKKYEDTDGNRYDPNVI